MIALTRPRGPDLGGAADTSMRTVSTTGVSMSFGQLAALTDVSLQVRQGELVGLIGANGAGKSTYLNVLSGVMRPTHGSVQLDDLDITGWSLAKRYRSGIHRTFQQPRLVPHLTVFENVMLAADSGTVSNAEGGRTGAAQLAAEALATVGIAESIYASRCSAVPATEHRWIEIARALALRPSFLLADEPNSGFTPDETVRLASLLLEIKAGGCGVLLVTHDVSLALRVTDRLSVLHHGRIIASGDPATVTQDDQVITAYLGERIARAAREALAQDEGHAGVAPHA